MPGQWSNNYGARSHEYPPPSPVSVSYKNPAYLRFSRAQVTLFMVLTAKIPRYTARLDCALFMKGFSSDAEFLSEKLGLVNEAVLEVVDSPRLKRLIEVVLAMGNYLNEGTRNGEAKAIKLASLLKLDTVK